MAMVDGCSWVGWDALVTMDVTGLQPWMSGQKTEKEAGSGGASGAGRSRKVEVGRRRGRC
jgi:hypothetical protein